MSGWVDGGDGDHLGKHISGFNVGAYNISGLHEYNMEIRRRERAEMPPRDSNGPGGCAGELLKSR